MSKVAHYLQEHLVGEVMTSTDARRYFATDASILQIAPALVVYPRNENDVRKTARFTWQLAERGRVISLTARGGGSNQSGAAIGNGIMLVFPAHMNRILEVDTKGDIVVVEPGINYGKLQQALFTHGRFLPPAPTSLEYSTIGGAVATNTGGERSSKYGDTKNFVRALRVVLANGEVMETGRLSKREFSKKLGLATFEGEIYRSVDTLLEENRDLVERLEVRVPRNNAGYNLLDVKQRDGSFDLTPLFVGSQGTLGIITEAVLATEPYNPQTSLCMAYFDSLEKAQTAVLELRDLQHPPSAIELVDDNLLKQIHDLNPNQLKGIVEPPFPRIVLVVEFDDSEKTQKKQVKKIQKIFEKYSTDSQASSDPEQAQQFWKVRQASSVLIAHNEGLRRSVPLFDAAVPAERLREYLDGLYNLFEVAGIAPAVWGHAGDGVIHMQPRLNLGQTGDRQKAFRLLDEHAKLVLRLSGTISSETGDGRLRAPYLESMYGTEVYTLLKKVKTIFDPYGTLNPGVKFGTSIDDLKAIVRPDYGIDSTYDHLPRS